MVVTVEETVLRITSARVSETPLSRARFLRGNSALLSEETIKLTPRDAPQPPMASPC